MNRIGRIAICITLATGMALAGSAVAGNVGKAGSVNTGPSEGNVKFFLADPELGLVGVYNVNGTELYFEARRALDEKTGAPGALSVRVIDAEARTLALGGEPYAKHWAPQAGEFTAKDGSAYTQLLSGLGDALGASNLHASLSAEKSALAALARQAAGASGYPLRANVDVMTYAAPDAAQVSDFYLQSARDVGLDRQKNGELVANLGNGIELRASQQFVADEPDAEGRMGRFDTYSMVKAGDGYVMATELGGDSIPQGWSEAMELDNRREHHALAADFGRAASALNALAYGARSEGTALSQDDEQASMQRLAQGLATHLLPVRDEATADRDVTRAAGGRYQTYIQVWRKPFVVIAEHSGTRVGKWRYNSATSSVKTHQGWTSYCNHGTCAASSPMTHKCTFTGPRLTYYRVPSRRSDAGGHTCSTGYWAVAMGGRHNCHDDSSVQVRAVRGQAYSANSGRCNDWLGWTYAPTCSAQ
ncbi:hypothetical protein WCE34_03040 [Luteimonas sp. MJ204]|uniref:hypothetical protein n=1 Tax=Luteimonas TaxID=83614 RepID=UPI0031B9CBB8